MVVRQRSIGAVTMYDLEHAYLTEIDEEIEEWCINQLQKASIDGSGKTVLIELPCGCSKVYSHRHYELAKQDCGGIEDPSSDKVTDCPMWGYDWDIRDIIGEEL